MSLPDGGAGVRLLLRTGLHRPASVVEVARLAGIAVPSARHALAAGWRAGMLVRARGPKDPHLPGPPPWLYAIADGVDVEAVAHPRRKPVSRETATRRARSCGRVSRWDVLEWVCETGTVGPVQTARRFGVHRALAIGHLTRLERMGLLRSERRGLRRLWAPVAVGGGA